MAEEIVRRLWEESVSRARWTIEVPVPPQSSYGGISCSSRTETQA
jgi:hypothetical protein